jgi:hypothetical protein
MDFIGDWRLPIGDRRIRDCRLSIDGLPIVDGRIANCRLPIDELSIAD